MDAFCLAAGKGTRFGELGRYLQKCMYPVGLTPFLAFSVANLLASGAVRPGRDVLTLIVGHHGDQVRAYFGADVDGLEVRYLEQTDPRGTGHALALAHAAFAPQRPVLCWLADGHVPARIFAELAAHAADTALTLAPGHQGENATVRVDTEGGRVVRAFRGSGERFDIGAWKLAPAALAAMTDAADDGEIRMLPNLQREIDLGTEVGREVGWVAADEWLHLGGTAPTPEANVARVEGRIRALHGLPTVGREAGATA